MNRAIKSSRSSYHLVPNANLCTLCKSREITIVSCKDSEDEEFLWRCNTCQGFQLQRITPTKRTNLSRAGRVEAEVPSGPAPEMSEAEMNQLLDESDGDSSSEESEYECDCNNTDCDECYEDASDDEASLGEIPHADHDVKPEGSRTTPQPTPRETLWTHLSKSHEMETQAVGLEKEAKMKELEGYRRAYWGSSYDVMVTYGTIDTLEDVYKRYKRVVPTDQPPENASDLQAKSDILCRLKDTLEDIRDRRLETQKSLDYIGYRLRQIQNRTSNLSVVMKANQDTAQPDGGSDSATAGQAQKREDPPTDVGSSPKRARIQPSPAKAQLDPGHDTSED